jgi:hypothetical protein
MKRTLTLAALAAGAGLGAGAAHGQIAIGAGIGTTGGTVEAQMQVAPFVQIRGGYNYFEYSVDDSYDDIEYEGDLDLTTLGAFVDLRPFGNSFTITGGAYFGGKTLGLAALPGQSYEIGGNTYSAAQVGNLAADVDLEDNAPFVGVGWDSTFQGDGNIGFKFIAGAMFTGSPQVNLSSTGGSLSNDATFQAELAEEEQNLQEDIDDFEIYPVVQAGLTLRF